VGVPPRIETWRSGADYPTGLSKAAITVGYKVPSTPAPASIPPRDVPTTKKPRAKGKARKAAKDTKTSSDEEPQTTTYSLTSRDLLDLAQAVAGRVELSDSLREGVGARNTSPKAVCRMVRGFQSRESIFE